MTTIRLGMALGAALAVSGAAALPASAQDETLRILTSLTIRDLNPAASGFWMTEFGVAETLIQFRQDGGHHPWLLDSYEMVDPLTWRLTLRPGLTFQNGRALDAEAAIRSIARQLENSPTSRAQLPVEVAFAATGPLEITATTEVPFPSLPGALATEAGFPIYDAEAVDTVGENWADLQGAGIYTGPYEVVSLDATEMVLARNDGYWEGEPALEGVRLGFVSDANARIAALQNGETDIALYPPTAAKAVVDALSGVHFQYGTPGSGGYMFYANTTNPPFDDMRIRQAVSFAIDYDELANVVFDGLVDVADGLYPAIAPWAIQNLATDADAASRLLDDAGWTLAEDGIRYRNDTPLRLTVVLNPSQPDVVTLGTAVQADLAEYGIVVELVNTEDSNTFVRDNRDQWHGFIANTNTVGFGGVPEAYIDRYLVSSGDLNHGALADDELDALAEELAVTTDAARRQAILSRIQDIVVVEQAYTYPLVLLTRTALVTDRYADYRPGFNLFHVSWQTAPSE